MVLVDTTVLIDYINGTVNPHTDWLDRELQRQPLGLTDLILCEVLQGIRHSASFRIVRQNLRRFACYSSCGEDLAVHAAQNYRLLRASGYTVRKTIDCLIATYCLREGHTLLHRDRDFEAFEQYLGLRVIHP